MSIIQYVHFHNHDIKAWSPYMYALVPILGDDRGAWRFLYPPHMSTVVLGELNWSLAVVYATYFDGVPRWYSFPKLIFCDWCLFVCFFMLILKEKNIDFYFMFVTTCFILHWGLWTPARQWRHRLSGCQDSLGCMAYSSRTSDWKRRLTKVLFPNHQDFYVWKFRAETSSFTRFKFCLLKVVFRAKMP